MHVQSHLFSWKVLAAAVLILSAATASRAVDIPFESYAAVAFSESTGEYGYAWDQRSRATAERTALAHCPYRDAKIVGWVQGGWLVLAVGAENAYGIAWEYGEGARLADAVANAEKECRDKGQRVATLVCLCSGDVDPRIVRRTGADSSRNPQ